jgi:hypothetical protein
MNNALTNWHEMSLERLCMAMFQMNTRIPVNNASACRFLLHSTSSFEIHCMVSTRCPDTDSEHKIECIMTTEKRMHQSVRQVFVEMANETNNKPLPLPYPESHPVETTHSTLRHRPHSIILYPTHPSPYTVALTNNLSMC